MDNRQSGVSRPPAATRGIGSMSFERQVLLSAWLVALPAIIVASVVLWIYAPAEPFTAVCIVIALLVTAILAARLRHVVVYPLYTLANLLEALREGDYSLRGSRAQRRDAIGEVVWEVNTLSQTLRDQRLKVEETSALLGKIIASIDIAIFSFDGGGCLRLINPAGERLLAMRAASALGKQAADIGLHDALAVEGGETRKRGFPGGSGRWDVRRFTFREGGRPHHLLVITDLSRALREEERQAWQRLIRVLGHELNNSLAPIKSMAGTVSSVIAMQPLPDDWNEDALHGLRVIGDRADALARFMVGYASLARLPPPKRQAVELVPLLQRVVALEQRLPVRLEPGPVVRFEVDPDQLEQALINLVKNAVEASMPLQGGVQLRWTLERERLRIEVLDEGQGLGVSENLFVPFFTTKPGGSGIGLVLAQQIVEGHGGVLTLEDRGDRRGCVARIELPLERAG
jgi:two-component system, NtrC family, nitrogen regulation sensor histidine kinase NtrY